MFHRTTPAFLLRRSSVQNASYIASLFRGQLDATEMFPYPCSKLPSEDAENMQTLIKDVSEAGASAPKRAAFLETNVAGLQVPEHLGGLGLSHVAHAHVAERIAAAPVNAADAYIGLVYAEASRVVQLLLVAGTKEQQARCFGDITEGGKKRLIWAADEAAVGEDASATATTATFDTDSSSYILSGTKHFCGPPVHLPDGSSAEGVASFLVLANVQTQQSDAQGNPEIVQRLCWFLVDRSAVDEANAAAPSNSSTAKSANNGRGWWTGALKEGELVTASSENGELGVSTLHLNNVRVPTSALVGTAGEGYKLLRIAQCTTSYALAATVLGLGRTVLNRIAAEMQNETGDGLVEADTYALIAARVYALESVVYALAANFDKQVEDSLLESLAAVNLAAQVAEVLEAEVSVVAPRWASSSEGVTTLRQLRRAGVAANSCPDVARQALASCGSDDYAVQFQKTSTLETMQVRTLRSVGIYDKLPQLAVCQAESKALEGAIVKFSEEVERLIVRFGPSTVKEQLHLCRLADAVTHLYSASASLARAQRAHSTKQPSVAQETALAGIWTRHAVEESYSLCSAVQSSADEVFSRIASDVCDRHGVPSPTASASPTTTTNNTNTNTNTTPNEA